MPTRGKASQREGDVCVPLPMPVEKVRSKTISGHTEELEAIDESEQQAYASARDEVYVGFHELGSGSAVTSGSALSVSVEEAPLPYWVPTEPEDGPTKDELLKRALDRTPLSTRFGGHVCMIK